MEAAGPRWITHHHYQRERKIEEYIRGNRVVLITTIRHPADTLISMYHHITRFQFADADRDELRRMMREDFAREGIIPDRVGAPFYADIACSIGWARSGMARVVRYEDLRTDTFRVVKKLTDEIRPVSRERIERAISACELDLMRRLAGKFGGFFRRGGIGEWRKLLPGDVVEMFRTVDPYPAQCAELGYRMDAGDVFTSREVPERRRHPFSNRERFENGVRIPAIAKKCFFVAFPGGGPVAFYRWLQAAAPVAGEAPFERLRVSNLALFLYEERADVRAAFPDLRGGDRVRFLEWFVEYGRREYELPDELVEPARRELAGFVTGRLRGIGECLGATPVAAARSVG